MHIVSKLRLILLSHLSRCVVARHGCCYALVHIHTERTQGRGAGGGFPQLEICPFGYVAGEYQHPPTHTHKHTHLLRRHHHGIWQRRCPPRGEHIKRIGRRQAVCMLNLCVRVCVQVYWWYMQVCRARSLLSLELSHHSSIHSSKCTSQLMKLKKC